MDELRAELEKKCAEIGQLKEELVAKTAELESLRAVSKPTPTPTLPPPPQEICFFSGNANLILDGVSLIAPRGKFKVRSNYQKNCNYFFNEFYSTFFIKVRSNNCNFFS